MKEEKCRMCGCSLYISDYEDFTTQRAYEFKLCRHCYIDETFDEYEIAGEES